MELILLVLPVLILTAIFPVAAFVFIPLDLACSVNLRDGRIETIYTISFGIISFRRRPGACLEVLLNKKVIISRRACGMMKRFIGRRDTNRAGSSTASLTGLVSAAPAMVRAAIRFLRLMSVHSLKADLRIGLGDPYRTGILYGALAAFQPFLNDTPGRSVSFEPVFDRMVIDGFIETVIRIRNPVLLITTGVKMCADPEFREALGYLSGGIE
ncbi:MAG: DUF2953 domain-containing protein [Methanoregulaceae archaeon]|nr:DUF2953 domain-containing protein [Methanoregulaceae archaeon]